MRKVLTKSVLVAGLALIAGLYCTILAHAQLRVPPTHVATLAAQPDENATVEETESVTLTTRYDAPLVPVQHVMPPQAQTQTPTQAATQPVAAQTPVAQPQQVVPQVQPQLQVALPQQGMMQPQAVMPQPMVPGMMGGAIVIPVTVPQYMTYTPQPVTMMVNRPAQLVIPQYPAPYPAPMQQPMYDPMAMQMMQQQMMMQPMMPMMQPPMMQPPAPPQQPIPVKMILPDGSTVSIKHYVPGQFFKNVCRAVTP